MQETRTQANNKLQTNSKSENTNNQNYPHLLCHLDRSVLTKQRDSLFLVNKGFLPPDRRVGMTKRLVFWSLEFCNCLEFVSCTGMYYGCKGYKIKY